MARFCSKCGKEIEEWAVICPHCGAQTTDKTVSMEEDKVNAGFIVLSVLIPIAGIILWAVMHNETPKAAKTYLIVSLIVWGLCILLSGCTFIFLEPFI